MFEPILEKLGLSMNEAKIYESLIQTGEATISQISVNAKIHRRNAYDAIHRLLNKGLIFQIIAATDTKYNAVDPAKLKELLAERENELNQIIPHLQKQYQHQDIPEAAYIYKGLEGQKALWREMIRVGEPIKQMGSKAQWFDPDIEPARNAFFREINKKKIPIYHIFDHEVKTKLRDFINNYPTTHMKYRYLPADYSTNSVMVIFGNFVVTHSGAMLGKFKEDTVFFVLHSKDLADSYRKWFDYMWNMSKNT